MPAPLDILVIDDDANFQRDLCMLLGSEAVCRSAADIETARRAISESEFSVVLLDIDLGGGDDGLKFLAELKESHPYLPVIMITADIRVPTVVQAMKLGAADFVGKQPEMESLRIALERAMAGVDLIRERDLYRDQVDDRWSDFVGDSEPMKRVRDDISRAAEVRSTVLISGESGTGKELVARHIHRSGPARQKPFIAVNCAAIPRELFESELFGHEKGAFTGAVARREGRFEQAGEGTIFLDEISELSAEGQAKLLRVLQDGRFYRVGGSSELTARARVIASTNRDLESEVKDSGFRSDLYYRLSVFQIRMPSLRERPDDIPALVRHFLERKSKEMHRKTPALPESALTRLVNYPWPGNVRELENCIEGALVRCDGDVLDDSLWDVHAPEDYLAFGSYEDAKRCYVERFQRDYLRTILRITGGNVSRAAERIGVTRQGLAKMMKACGLDRDDS